jgi:hypothetical protein
MCRHDAIVVINVGYPPFKFIILTTKNAVLVQCSAVTYYTHIIIIISSY